MVRSPAAAVFEVVTDGTSQLRGGTPAGGGTGVAGISGTTNAAQYTVPTMGRIKPRRPADASTQWDFFSDKGLSVRPQRGQNLAENSRVAVEL